MDKWQEHRITGATSELKHLGLADTFVTKGLRVGFEHPSPRRDDWACADHPDPAVFDPADDDALGAAVAVCDTCPARDACLALGLARDEWGVWGGVLLEGGKPLAAPRRPGRPKKVAVRGAA